MIVMIIDDDEGIADALSAAVELKGHTAIACLNPRRAVDDACKHTPNLIFLDLFLSGVNGGDIATQLKRHPLTKDTPIVMMSAHPSAQESARAAQVDEFLPKPFSLDQFFSLIDRMT